MTLNWTEYDWATEYSTGWKKENELFFEKVIEHALIELNAKDEDELVVINVEGNTCVARVINDFTPIDILDEVIIFNIKNQCYTRDTVSIKKEITFA